MPTSDEPVLVENKVATYDRAKAELLSVLFTSSAREHVPTETNEAIDYS